MIRIDGISQDFSALDQSQHQEKMSPIIDGLNRSIKLQIDSGGEEKVLRASISVTETRVKFSRKIER